MGAAGRGARDQQMPASHAASQLSKKLIPIVHGPLHQPRVRLLGRVITSSSLPPTHL